MSEPPPSQVFKNNDDRELLHLITQETRFVLLQNIIGHPDQLPSVPELAYLNPNKNEGTLYKHLAKLVDANILEVYTLSSDQRERDLPFKFYGMTEKGEAFLSQYDIFASEETLHEIYAHVEKSERIRRFESAPRPA